MLGSARGNYVSDRKYRQRGYQDDGGVESTRPGSSTSRPRRDPRLKPSGRGLGKPTATTFRCKVCGTENTPESVVASSRCSKCDADLHTCTHCTFFDTSAPNQCRQSDAERIGSKAKANECVYFEPRLTHEFKQESESPRDAKAAFDSLFNF